MWCNLCFLYAQSFGDLHLVGKSSPNSWSWLITTKWHVMCYATSQSRVSHVLNTKAGMLSLNCWMLMVQFLLMYTLNGLTRWHLAFLLKCQLQLAFVFSAALTWLRHALYFVFCITTHSLWAASDNRVEEVHYQQLELCSAALLWRIRLWVPWVG